MSYSGHPPQISIDHSTNGHSLNGSSPDLINDHSCSSNGLKPSVPRSDFRGYDHATWYVGNAKQAASWYVTRMGCRLVAYRGLETGSRCLASYVVTNGQARFVLTSCIRGLASLENDIAHSEKELAKQIHAHLEKHGDGVKDIAFEVDDARALYASVEAKGATTVQEPIVLEDENGMVIIAAIKAYGDTTHTFVERRNYRGVFLPGYQPVTSEDPIVRCLPEVRLEVIDHFVGNQDWGEMGSVCDL